MDKQTINITTVGKIVIFLGTALAAYLTSNYNQDKQLAAVHASLQEKISEDRNSIVGLQTNQVNSEKRLDRFESKLDALLVNQGINPNKIK